MLSDQGQIERVSGEGWVEDLADELYALPAYFDRVKGPGPLLFDAVHRGATYDVEVDTERATAAECAQRIKTFLGSGIAPAGFRAMHGRGSAR